MIIKRLWPTLLICTIFLTLPQLATNANAALIDDISQDLSPLDGYIIMQVNDEYLIDVDADSGAQPGDLLNVSRKGEKIIHPISGEVLGTLDENIALLSIIRVKSGYSYAKVISGATTLAKGTPIKRFSGLNAEFKGQGSAATKLYKELSAALPALDWQGLSTPSSASRTAATDILFALTDTQLEVRNSVGELIRSYPADEYILAAGLPKASVTMPAAAGIAYVLPTQNKPATGLINYESESPGMALLGTIPGDTLMADFIQTPEGLLLAATDGSTIRVYRVAEQLQLLAEYNFTDRNLHALSWWQPTPGTTLLAVSGSVESPPTASTSTETTPLSSILQLSVGRLQPVHENINYFLGTFDRNGDGAKEMLLGQSLDLDNFYGRVVQLQRQGNKLNSRPPEFKIPRPFPVQGSIFADLTGNNSIETVTLRNGLLTIYQNKRKLYQSRKEFGGSISQLSYDINPDQMDALFTTVSFEVDPVAADIDGDGQQELIAISANRPTFVGTFGTRPDIPDSNLTIFKYQDGKFIKGSISAKSDHPIQGLYVDKERILLVSTGHTTENNQETVSKLMIVSLRQNN